MGNVHSTPFIPVDTKPIEPTVNLSEEVLDTSPKKGEELPLSMYSERTGRPYSAEFFGLNKMETLSWGKSNLDKLNQIDSFVINELREQGLSETKESYKAYVEKLMDKVKVGRYEKTHMKIEKISVAIGKSVRSRMKHGN